MVGCSFPLLSFVFSATQPKHASLARRRETEHAAYPNPRVRLWLRQENQSTRHANSPPDRLSLSGKRLTLFPDGSIQSRKAGNMGSAGASIYYIVYRYSMPTIDIEQVWVVSLKRPCRSEFFSEA